MEIAASMAEINMSALFANAVDSIKMGIEDYARDTPARAVSAVRNFYAGVLLLGKEVLIRAAPIADPNDVIGAKYKPVPDGMGGVDYEIEGFQTIDFNTLGKRFKDFGVQVETKGLAELNALRNAIEHRYTDQPAQAVREAIARAFPITMALFHHADVHPSDVLGEAWTTMLAVRELYETERARCRETFSAINWVSATVVEQHLRCTGCGSHLIEQRDPTNDEQETMKLVCRSCRAEPNWDDAIVDAVDKALSGEAYERFKDASESGPIYTCQNCMRASYIDFEQACVLCGETFEWEQNCIRCSAGIPLEDAMAGFDEGMCSYCQHLYDKDD